jgi:hypothetical protein
MAALRHPNVAAVYDFDAGATNDWRPDLEPRYEAGFDDAPIYVAVAYRPH